MIRVLSLFFCLLFVAGVIDLCIFILPFVYCEDHFAHRICGIPGIRERLQRPRADFSIEYTRNAATKPRVLAAIKRQVQPLLTARAAAAASLGSL